jgi:hypothetical protein
MHFGLRMSNRWYGGYPHSDYKIRVSYPGHLQGDKPDLESDAVALRDLRGLLVGRRSPRTFKDVHDDVIVKAGEILRSRHVKRLADSWLWVSFARTRWRNLVRAIETAANKRTLQKDLDSGEQEIRIQVSLNGEPQEGGEFVLTAPVAQWLGHRLIEAAAGGLTVNGARVSIRRDKVITRRSHRR